MLIRINSPIFDHDDDYDDDDVYDDGDDDGDDDVDDDDDYDDDYSAFPLYSVTLYFFLLYRYG